MNSCRIDGMMEPRELFKITSRFYEALNPTDSDTEAAAHISMRVTSQVEDIRINRVSI